MATELTIQPPASNPGGFVPPFAASWPNRLILALERLPGPSWLYYPGIWMVLFATTTVLQWAGEAYPVGTYNGFHAVWTAYIVAMPAIMRHLDITAARALAEFRPAMQISAAEYARLEYELTTLPALPTLVISVIPLLPVAYSLVTRGAESARPLEVALTPVSLAWTLILVVLFNFFAGPWLYQVIRQGRLVNRIYRDHTQLNLFELGPLYGFSGLTLRAAVAMAMLTTALYAAGSYLFSDPLSVLSAVLGLLVPVGIFVLPLVGIHNRLVREKVRVLTETMRRIEATIADLHAAVDAHALQSSGEIRETLSALQIEQQMVERIPTWPWQPETLRLLLSALFLPTVLFLIQFIFQLALGGR